MKIAFIGQKGLPAVSGGVERHVEDLAVRLVARGHKVIAYTRPHYTNPTLDSYKGIELISLPSVRSKSLDAITHTFLACFAVMRQRVDIIHFHSIGPSSLIGLAKLLNPGVKIVATVHSPDYYRDKWGFFARTYLKFGERTACRSAHATIAISKSLTENAEQNYGRPVSYIPNGVAVAVNREAQEIKKWGLEKDNYILSVARLVPEKGTHDLIEAYKNLVTDKKLVIVGSGAFNEKYEDYLKKLAGTNPNIIFTGNQSGDILSELFSNAYLFAQTSELEGLSIALLEAMSYGKRILISDIPENIEVIGQTGKTFKVKDIKDLTLQLNNCLHEGEALSELGQAAKERVTFYYHWDKITQSIENIYGELLTERFNRRNNKLMMISRFWTVV